MPVAEQPQASLTPVIAVENVADESATITGLIRIYRDSTGTMTYSSELATTLLPHHSSANIAALTPFDPPTPADDDYFVKADILASSILPGPPRRESLGAYYFDIKTPPMGAAPAGHHATHEDGGSDEIDCTGLSGTGAAPHAASHEDGGADELEVADLATSEMDDALVLAPDGAGGVEFRAEAGGDGGTMFDPQTLSDGANISWDLDSGGSAKVTLGGDRTLDNPTNMVDGAIHRLRVIQDGTGTRLLTFGAAYLWPGDVPPTLTATPGAVDVLLFHSDGSNMYCIGATFDVK